MNCCVEFFCLLSIGCVTAPAMLFRLSRDSQNTARGKLEVSYGIAN